MRLLTNSLIVLVAAFAITACTSASSTNSTDSTDQSAASTTSAAPAPASSDNSMTAASPAASMAAAEPAMGKGELPTYPGAMTEASGSSSNMGQAAAGKVMSSTDSFDKVYAWYQKNMPAGSEKAHVTTPVQSAIFTVGEAGKDQQSISITVSGGKTMITIAHVKM